MLESLRADDLEPWVEDLAHHAAEGLLAGTAPKALTYALRAAATAEAAQSSAEVALQLRRALAAAAVLPGFPVRERRELLRRLGVALRDTGDTDGRRLLVEAARLAEADGDLHARRDPGQPRRREPVGRLRLEPARPAVVAAVERALARPGLTARDRTLLTMALAGELTYVDNARSNQLFADARAMAETLDDAAVAVASCCSGSGRSRVLPAWRRGRRSATSSSRSTDDGELPARLRPLAHLARVSSALELGDADLARRCVRDARALAHPVRTPTGWAHLQFAEAGLALLDGDLERARGHAAALRPALQRVRRYTADSSPASILAVVETESGDIDAALGWLAPLLASPYAAPIRWLEAWVLSRRRPTRRRTGGAGRLRRPAARRLAAAPADHGAVHAAARVGDLRFLRRHLPDLETVADRFAFVGEGGFTLGPVGLAVAAAHLALGDPPPPVRTPSRRWPSPSGWARCCGCPGPASCSTPCRRPDPIELPIAFQPRRRDAAPWTTNQTSASTSPSTRPSATPSAATATPSRPSPSTSGPTVARPSRAGPRASCSSSTSTTTSRTPSSSRACGRRWRPRERPSTASRPTTATSTTSSPAGRRSPRALADPTVPFVDAQADATAFAEELQRLPRTATSPSRTRTCCRCSGGTTPRRSTTRSSSRRSRRARRPGCGSSRRSPSTATPKAPTATPSSPRCPASCGCSIAWCARATTASSPRRSVRPPSRSRHGSHAPLTPSPPAPGGEFSA